MISRARGIRIQTFERQLPQGIAAAYYIGYGGKVFPTFIVNYKLTKARRRAALKVILATARGVFDVVKIAELAA